MGGTETAIVSCAGTPGVSDPGESVVEAVANSNRQTAIGANKTIQIVPIPGPSALTAILSVADFVVEPVAFYGFMPVKKGRQSVLRRLKESSGKHGLAAAIFYESPHRIGRTLNDLVDAFGAETHIVVGRELTKLHEEVWYGTLAEAMAHFKKPKGEFVLLLKLG